MKKLFNRTALLLLLTLIFLLTCGFVKPNEGYLKSATYYGDDWVVNFWNGEMDHLEEDLVQIREDGFNSIILVLPWREFQPDNGSFNTYALQNFHHVMQAAREAGLSVMLRVGYTWDYYPEGKSASKRVDELPYDIKMRNQWFNYIERIYREVSQYENFAGGFMTWEDFWTYTSTATAYGKNAKSIANAQKSGYTEYALAHYGLEQLRELYGDASLTEESIYFPSRASYALKVFYDWYDSFLMQLLSDSQAYFPDLSFEIRLDGDQVLRPDGSTEWYYHDKTYPQVSASYLSTMYGIPMTIGEGQVSAERALQGTIDALNIARVENKKVYVEQLLFTESTPGYESAAKIVREQQPEYLLSLASVLPEYTNGYGIWVYRDYGNNKLYNPQFALEDKGWKLEEGARIERFQGSQAARLSQGAIISQGIQPSTGAHNGKETTIRFRLAGEGVVKVSLGDQSYQFGIEKGAVETKEVKVSGNQAGQLRFESVKGYVYIDDVNVYNFITEGHLYHQDGSEDYCIPALRELNSRL